MEKTPILKKFTKYVSLNILGMLGLSGYILADTFFVARGLGTNGIAALNLAIPIYSFIHGSGLMFGMGGGTKYSIFKNQNETKKANQSFTNTFLATIVVAFIFAVIGLFFSGNIIEILGANEDVYQMGQTYLQVILLFAPMFMLNNLLLCFVRNDGEPKLPMIAMIAGSLSNIVLDYIFIFPLNMGIFGAALATGLAPVISIIVLSPFFIKQKNSFHLEKLPFSIKMITSVVSCGIPSLITEVSSGIVIIVFNTIILTLHGNIGVAAYGIIANISLVIISIYTGIAQGIQPIISSEYGAKKEMNIKTVLRYALILMSAMSVIIYVMIFFGAPQVVSIFNSENNIMLQNIAVTGIKLYFIGCIFAGFNIIMSIYFTSTEKSRPAHIISLLRGFIIIIPIAYLFSKIGGILGVWLSFPFTELTVSVLGFVLFAITQKKAVAQKRIKYAFQGSKY